MREEAKLMKKKKMAAENKLCVIRSFLGVILILIGGCSLAAQTGSNNLRIALSVYDSLNGNLIRHPYVSLYNDAGIPSYADTLREDTLRVPAGRRYLVQVECAGFNMRRFIIGADARQVISIRLALYPILVYHRIFPVFNFIRGSIIPLDTANYYRSIKAVAAHLKYDTTLHVTIQGYWYEDGVLGKRLARNRALLVYSHLVQYGVSKSQLFVSGASREPYKEVDDYQEFPKGAILSKSFIHKQSVLQQSIASNLNRRVEIHVVQAR
jgi:hypothetical protein